MADLDLSSYISVFDIVNNESNKGMLPLINVLGQRLPFFADASWQECNEATQYRGVRVSSEPSGTYTGYDEGSDPEAGSTDPFIEPTCMLSGNSPTDPRKFRHRKNGMALRARYDAMFMSGMAKTMMDAWLYGDRSVDGKRINGILTRSDYNTLSSDYVHDNSDGSASATANKTSILIIGWGNDFKVSFLYPQDDAPGAFQLQNPTVSGVGIRMRDTGGHWWDDASSKKYWAEVTAFEANFGLAIHDPRYIQRVCNISTTNVDGDDDISFDENFLIDAVNNMQDTDNAVIYVNRTVRGQMWKRGNDKANVNFRNDKDRFGKIVPWFNDIPIHLNERITNTEATVS